MSLAAKSHLQPYLRVICKKKSTFNKIVIKILKDKPNVKLNKIY